MAEELNLESCLPSMEPKALEDDSIFSFLNDEEKQAFLEIINNLEKDRSNSTVWKQVREVKPFKEWIQDSYYCGYVGAGLFPHWKRVLTDVFDNSTPENRCNELIITGGLGCRPLGTKYVTSAGYLDLDSIPVGSTIQGPKGPVKIVDKHHVGLKKCYKITFSNGDVQTLTYDHRLKVLTDAGIEWCRAENLTENTNVLLSRNSSELESITYDPDAAYLCGYIMGYRTSAHGGEYLGVLFPLDQVYMYDLCDRYGLDHYTKDSRKNMILARSSVNPPLAKSWGFGHSWNKQIPDWFYSCDKESIKSFIAGLIDSYGHVDRHGLDITLKSEELVRGLQRLFTIIGISSRISVKTLRTGKYAGNSYYRLHVVGYTEWSRLKDIPLRISYKKKALDSLTISAGGSNRRDTVKGLSSYTASYFKGNHEVFSRSEDRFKKLRYGTQEVGLPLLMDYLTSHPGSDDMNTLVDGRYTTIQVVSMEELECECGDIEVEGHEYMYNGLWNHNTGKSTTACVAAMYTLYKLSCYENLASYFGLIPGSIIALFYFSVSRAQAELTGYGVLKNYIDSTPYFNDLFLRNQRLNSMMSFPESVLVVSGSDNSHAIGMNVVTAILDEANFRQSNAQSVSGGINNEKTQTFYMSLLQRGASRFLRNGINESMMILISSNTTTSSFTDQRIAQARTNPHTRIINARLWDVKPKGTYSSKGFWVFCGNETYDAQILDTIADLNLIADSIHTGPFYGDVDYVMRNEANDNLKELCVWVPNDFRRQFDDDIYQSLQDIAGMSVCPSGRLFNNHIAYNKAVTEYDLKNPFTKPFITLSTGDSTRVTDYIDKTWRPRNRNLVHHAHFDQSTSNDRTGIAFTYIEKWEKDEETGVVKPYFITDVICCFMPPKPPHQLSIKKCADILYVMRDGFHIPLGKITYDQFQSAMMIQELQSQGFDAERLSVDRDADAYLFWVECILDGRWHAPNHPIVEAELFGLVLDRTKPGGKVDHEGKTDNNNPLSGTSKDVTDAIAGSIWNAYQAGVSDQESAARTHDGTEYGFVYKPQYSDEALLGFEYERLSDPINLT